MAMLQQEASSTPNDNDSLNRSNDVVSTVEGTSTNKQQPQQPTEGDFSEDLSHLTISDSKPETRPEESSATGTNQVPVVDPSSQTLTSPTATTADQQRNMKLIVRSQYWGRTLKGKTCRCPASLNRAYRTISCQAVLYNTDEYWGCCPHHGKRVLELQECHFQDAMPDQNWDLYSTANWVSPNYCINDFFLLPQNQNIIDVSRNIYSGWSFVGTCTANSIRDDLDGMLRPWLSENDNYGYRYHHVHIEIMMDKAFDRETPRSRKVNNEKARQERQQVKTTVASTQESSEATDETGSSGRDGPPSAAGNPFVLRSSYVHGGPAPPIPHVISNDSSSVFSHSVASSAMAYHDGYSVDTSSFWSPPAPPGMPHAPHNVGPPSIPNPHPGMQWHPGSNHPLASPIPHHHHHVSWPSPSGLPPPPPPLLGQMPSPPIAQQMSELQQYLMYSDPHTAASTHGFGHHHHHQYYHNAAVATIPHHLQQYPPTASPYRVPNGAHIPSEILSSPTPAVSASIPPTSPPITHTTTLQRPQLNTSNDNNAPAEVAAEASPSSNASALESGIATLSVSTKDSSVVTTVASNNMVASTCWSKAAGTNGKSGNSPTTTKKIGRLRLPHTD